MVWDIEPPLVPILDFEVERSETIIFFENRNITDPITYNPGRQYDDHKANFNAKSYYYQITLSDSCGLNSNPIYVSKVHRTIFLQGELMQTTLMNYIGIIMRAGRTVLTNTEYIAIQERGGLHF